MPRVFENFGQLDDEKFFVDFVDEQFLNGWPRVSKASRAKISTDTEAIKVAYQNYMASLSGYELKLPSKNPDHYKRAGSGLASTMKRGWLELFRPQQCQCRELTLVR